MIWVETVINGTLYAGSTAFSASGSPSSSA